MPTAAPARFAEMNIILTLPPAVPLNALRDALHAAHLPAVVAPLGRDGVKVKPGRGICRKSVEAFVKGFVAGYSA